MAVPGLWVVTGVWAGIAGDVLYLVNADKVRSWQAFHFYVCAGNMLLFSASEGRDLQEVRWMAKSGKKNFRGRCAFQPFPAIVTAVARRISVPKQELTLTTPLA